MAVFKIYMKIAKKNIWLILLYLVIFFVITVMFQQVAGENAENFEAENVPVGVINEDGGPASASLISYIGRTNDVTMLTDDREALWEDLFYRNVGYIVWIPEDFMEKCIQGDEKLRVMTVPGTYAGAYIDRQIDNYLNFARSCSAAGFTEKEIAQTMSERKEARTELIDFGGNMGQTPAYAYYYRYLPFLFLSVMCYVMGYILMGVRRGNLPERMRASAVSVQRQNLEGFLASGLISAGLWVICTAAVLILYHEDFLSSKRALWYMLNSFALLLVALSLAYLVGILVKTSNSLNGIVNILSLGMCFLCGTFVDLDYLNSSVRTAARFLPVYWYESANARLIRYADISGAVRMELLGEIGIQVVFAAVFVCAALAVSKNKASKQAV